MKDKLEGKEEIIVWIANLINPLIAGFLFYYSWRRKFPDKARQANKISFIVFVVYVVGYIVYKLVTGSSF